MQMTSTALQSDFCHQTYCSRLAIKARELDDSGGRRVGDEIARPHNTESRKGISFISSESYLLLTISAPVSDKFLSRKAGYVLSRCGYGSCFIQSRRDVSKHVTEMAARRSCCFRRFFHPGENGAAGDIVVVYVGATLRAVAIPLPPFTTSSS